MLDSNSVKYNDGSDRDFGFVTEISASEPYNLEQLLLAQRELGLALDGAEEFDEAITMSVIATLQASQMDVVGFYKYVPENQRMDFVYGTAIPGLFDDEPKFSLAGHKWVKAVAGGKPIYYNTVGLIRNKITCDERIRSAGMIPIHHKHEFLGFFSIASFKYDSIPEKARLIIETFTAQVSNCISRIFVELQLKHDRDVLTHIFDTSPTAIIVYDENGYAVMANKASEHIFGVPAAEITGHYWLDHSWKILDNESGQSELQIDMIRNSLRTSGEIRDIRMLIEKSDGRKITVSVNAASLHSADGEIDGTVIAVTDISKIANMSRMLRQRESRYRGLIESQMEMVLRIDMQGRITFMNEAGIKLIGLSKDEIIDHDLRDFIYAEDRASVFQGIINMFSPPHRLKNDCRIQTIRGARWVSFDMCLISDRAGTPFEFQCVGRDMNEHKQALDALKKAMFELQQRSEANRAFLTKVTHEIRTPLTFVIGYSQLLKEGVTDDDEVKKIEICEKIHTAADQLLSIVDDALEYSRLNSEHDRIRPTVCNPVHITREALQTYEVAAKRKGLDIQLHTTDNNHVGYYDERKMAVVISKLLSNAVQFTDSGSIDVTVDGFKDHMQLIVADTGRGIDENMLLTIFDEFQQLPQPDKYRADGFGLGLTVVDTIITMLAGTLIVSSLEGIGTAFTLLLPSLQVM